MKCFRYVLFKTNKITTKLKICYCNISMFASAKPEQLSVIKIYCIKQWLSWLTTSKSHFPELVFFFLCHRNFSAFLFWRVTPALVASFISASSAERKIINLENKNKAHYNFNCVIWKLHANLAWNHQLSHTSCQMYSADLYPHTVSVLPESDECLQLCSIGFSEGNVLWMVLQPPGWIWWANN